MPLPQDQQIELDGFLRELEQKKPSDFLQFAADYFNRRLGEQRAFIKNQEGLAASKGIQLFPEASQGANRPRNQGRGPSTAAMGDEDVLFKSPFVDHDPHSKHINGSITEDAMEQDDSSIFKGDFNVGQESHKSLQNPLDPKASESRSFSSMARPSIANPEPLPVNFNAQRRTSVSAETLKPDHFNNWKPGKYTEKTQEQLKGLLEAVGKNFLFNKLDADSKTLVLSYLEEKFVKAGEVIIRQGDEGDYFYIVEKGTVDFYLDGKKVNTHTAGCSFGELALMYNSPRAATAVAVTDCTLWALDRLTFRRILLSGSFKKRILYDDFLKSMPLLKSLSTYHRAKLADALNIEVYEAGDVIIREGDTGENFYFIEYGEVEVSKKDQGAIGRLKAGDYFGEVALLTDLPRQATITAKAKTKVATLGKSGFQRLLGPAVEVLKLNDPTRSERE